MSGAVWLSIVTRRANCLADRTWRGADRMLWPATVPRSARVQSGERAQQRRLAAAVRPDERDDPAGDQLDARAVNDLAAVDASVRSAPASALDTEDDLVMRLG